MRPAVCGVSALVLVLVLAAAVTGQDSRPAAAAADPARTAGRLVKLLELDLKAEAAGRALVRLGKQALPPLIVALDDPRLQVRVRAVRILGAMGSDASSAVPRLEKLAKDENGQLAFPAFKALTRIRGSRRTLVADYAANRIFAVDKDGKTGFALNDIFGVWDAEFLPNGNLLLTEFSVSRVREITPSGKTVWVCAARLKNPYDADRLPNGNTLIADTFGRRVIEVNKAGKVVWKYDDRVQPYDVDRLANGNTLIADSNDDRIIEVDKAGKIVWKLENTASVHDADRLWNGNTLLTIRVLNLVREVDPKGKTVWELRDLKAPSDADRLANGHTVVAENGMVREFDRDGKQVHKIETGWAVEVNRY